MRPKPIVIVFARVPQLGRVKTRLARGIGAIAALGFYRETLTSILHRLARDRRWQVEIAATPDRLAGSRWHRPHRLAVHAQGPGDLGRRMLRALRRAGRRPCVIVGCDVPDLDAAVVAEALARLARSDVVLGPSGDGGFWLIGWRGVAPGLRLLDGVRWSTAHARADTLGRLQGKRVELARMLDDVDDASDLARLGLRRWLWV